MASVCMGNVKLIARRIVAAEQVVEITLGLNDLAPKTGRTIADAVDSVNLAMEHSTAREALEEALATSNYEITSWNVGRSNQPAPEPIDTDDGSFHPGRFHPGGM